MAVHPCTALLKTVQYWTAQDCTSLHRSRVYTIALPCSRLYILAVHGSRLYSVHPCTEKLTNVHHYTALLNNILWAVLTCPNKSPNSAQCQGQILLLPLPSPTPVFSQGWESIKRVIILACTGFSSVITYKVCSFPLLPLDSNKNLFCKNLRSRPTQLHTSAFGENLNVVAALPRDFFVILSR